MTSHVANSIQNQIENSITLIEKRNMEGDIDGLFAKYVLPANQKLKIEWRVECANNGWLTVNGSSLLQGNFVDLASLGISLHFNASSNEARTAFIQGFERLKKKEPLPGDRISFAFNPRHFIGIVLGIKAMDEPYRTEGIRWLREVYQKRKAKRDFDIRNQLLFSVVESMLYEKQILFDGASLSSLSTLEEYSIVYWGLSRGSYELHNVSEYLPRLRGEIMSRFTLQNVENFDETLLPFILACVTKIVLETTDAILISPDHVSKILGNFESAMKRWVWNEKKQWPIEDEYDVQSILYLILRSYFDDAEYEDPTPKFGHGSSRLDIKLPSVGIIIEAKFIRRATDFPKIEDDIKIDVQDYQISTPYRKIIVFAYDNTSSVQEHQTTIRALKQLDGIVDVIIVSKPSQIG